MKLLIITQKVDKNDPVLGFFHRWVEVFAEKYESIIVICLEKGEYSLPKHVTVISLGKEEGVSRLVYILRFYRYIISYRNSYSAVFVHMNQEYILLGAMFWKMFKKGTILWRNHAQGNIMTRIAVWCSDIVLTTSPQSFTARFKKTKMMPVGIDTSLFEPNLEVHKKPQSILFLGRIAPVKNVDVFIEALKLLKNNGVVFTATIAGSSLPRDAEYEHMLRKKVELYQLNKEINFTGSVTQSEARTLYHEHEIYVNLTPSGSLDKTIFESLASGLVTVTANNFLKDVLPAGWFIGDIESAQCIADVLKNVLVQESPRNIKDIEGIAGFIEKHRLHSLTQELLACSVAVSKEKQ
ncbi:MAG: glycosyltransferase family 4 protein [Candidatus Paceibacterota bacterium]